MSERLTSEELIKVVDNLIGITLPYGEDSIDEERLKNTQLVIALVDHLMDELEVLSEYEDHSCEGASIIGAVSKTMLRSIHYNLKDKFIKENKNER